MQEVPSGILRLPHEEVRAFTSFPETNTTKLFSGLMDKEEFEKLGFTDEISWESEEAEKKFLFDKISKLKTRARDQAKKHEDYLREKERAPYNDNKPSS